METFSYHLALNQGRMDLPGFIARCAELGLEGVQLNMGYLARFLQANPAGIRQVREMAAGLGLFLEVDDSGTDPAHLTGMLNLCRELGADVLRTYVSLGGNLAEELARAPEQLRTVAPLCRKLGVRIALENHEFETSAEIMRLVRAVDSEWVGALIDTGNSMMVWEEPATATRTMAPAAVSTHFKDHIVILEDGAPRVVGVALGTGSADCAECFRLLATESPLERLVIEVCYGYSAPFRRPVERGGGGRLGAGAFRVAPDPLDPAWAMPHPGRMPPAELDRLLAWEAQAVIRSAAYVQGLNDNLPVK